MPSHAGPKGRGGADLQVSRAIELLTMITSAPQGRIGRDQAMRALGVDERSLTALCELIGSLVDETTGVRAVITEEEGDLVLMGDGAALRPLRLSFEEGLVLSHVLNAAHMDAEARDRISRAILPLGSDGREPEAIGDGAGYGEAFPALAEAVRIGIRCRLLYRSADDDAPAWRLIDPAATVTEQGVPYLIAWDVEADGERRYRLDRVADLIYTDDSVVPHRYSNATAAESIRSGGASAVVSFSSRPLAERTSWAGLGPISPARAGGRPRARLSYTSETWLFDQIAAAGGEIEIVEPADLRDRFAIWAGRLVAS